jgi:thiol:disulfide interchange protein DsbD
MPPALRWRYRSTAIGLVVVAAIGVYGWQFPLGDAMARHADLPTPSSGGANDAAHVAFRKWSAEDVEREVTAGRPVFVDVTASYCTNCKVNKATAIHKPQTVEKLASHGFVSFQADFSNGDERIFELLKAHNRLGPPLNLVYPPGKLDSPIVLDPLFTLDGLLSKLDEAAASQVASVSTQQ